MDISERSLQTREVGRPVSFVNNSTGEEFEDEDEYLRSMKQDDSYQFSYDYEYVADRFGAVMTT